jgi:hypothetical protein
MMQRMISGIGNQIWKTLPMELWILMERRARNNRGMRHLQLPLALLAERASFIMSSQLLLREAVSAVVRQSRLVQPSLAMLPARLELRTLFR